MAIWSDKKYNRINWQNRPSTATALGATNLNKIDVFCNEVDNAMIQMDAQKLNLSTANSMISSLTIDVDTGVITAKQLDGTTFTWDLNLEKIPVSFSLSEDGILTMTTEDGTEWTCNISELIKDYVFDDSDTIAFEKEFSEEDESGKGAYHVTASVKAGSINETHLNPDYRADILTYKNQALTAANDSLTYSKDSKRWAVGDAEYEGSATDNSKYYKEQAEAAKVAAEQARDEAQAATGTVIATTTQVGVVKPDGTTIDVTSDGTISAKSATSTSAGIIKPDGETVTVDEYGVLHGAQKFDEEGYVFVDNETVIPPGQEDEAILDADKLGGEPPSYYAKQDDVGEKTNLNTASKTDLVAAINEVDGNIGDLSGLTTTAKTNLVSAVNELNQNMSVVGINWTKNGQSTLTTANVFEKVIEISDLPAGTYLATVRMQYNDGVAPSNVISWVSIINSDETSSAGPGNAITIPGGTGYPGASMTRIITLNSPGAISAWVRSSNGSAMFTGTLQVIRIK